MRVTQLMLSNNLLRNLNTSYGKLSKLQQQIESGSKINRPSDDPVVALKGMSYRIDLDKVAQFQRNIREANTWLDSTDESLGQVGDTLHRVKELLVQASNDTNTSEDREKIHAEISQLKNHMIDIANTKVGDRYIFSGAHTDLPLYKDGAANPNVTDAGAARLIAVDVFDGISLEINTVSKDVFNDIVTFMNTVETTLTDGSTGEKISKLIGDGPNTGLSALTEKVLTARANVGARQNRTEMMENRLALHKVNVTKQKSENEDTDYALAITEMTTAQSIHQASLSVGANIIQQTLVDFMR